MYITATSYSLKLEPHLNNKLQ